MEQAVYGHDFKTLDYTATFTCNIAKVAQDDYWVGSEMFNCAEGRRSKSNTDFRKFLETSVTSASGRWFESATY